MGPGENPPTSRPVPRSPISPRIQSSGRRRLPIARRPSMRAPKYWCSVVGGIYGVRAAIGPPSSYAVGSLGSYSMNRAKLGVLALLASTAAIAGCSSDATSPNALAQGASATATVAMAPTSVDNFMLVDANMEAHELYRLADAKAVVIVSQSNGDAVMRGLAPTL